MKPYKDIKHKARIHNMNADGSMALNMQLKNATHFKYIV